MRNRQSGPDRTRFGTLTQGLGLVAAGAAFAGAELAGRPAGAVLWPVLAFCALMVLGGIGKLVRVALWTSIGPPVAGGVRGLPGTWVAGGTIPSGRQQRVTAHDGFLLTTGPRPMRTIRYPGLAVTVAPGRVTIGLRSWWHTWSYRLVMPPPPCVVEPSGTTVVPVTSPQRADVVWFRSANGPAPELEVKGRAELLAALAQAGFTVEAETWVPVMPTVRAGSSLLG